MAQNYSNASFSGNVDVAGIFRANIASTGSQGIIVTGVVGQTADLQQWKSSAGLVSRIDAGGRFRTTNNIYAVSICDTTDTGPYLTLYTTATVLTNRGLVNNPMFQVQGMAAQTGDLQRWIDVNSVTLAKVSAAGVITGTAFSGTARVRSVAAAPKTNTAINLPEPSTGAQIATATLDKSGYVLRPPGAAGYVTNVTGGATYPAASITGDIEVIVKVSPAAWVGTLKTLVSKYETPTNSRGWRFDVSATGALQLGWSTDGTAGTFFQATSSAIVPFTGTQVGWVRVVLDVNNTVGGANCIFYTSTDGTTWTQLGTTQVSAITSIFNNPAIPYQLGSFGLSLQPFAGDFLYVEVRNGIGGANVVPSDPSLWTVLAGAVVYPGGAGYARFSANGRSTYIAPSVTGDLDVRVKLAPTAWSSGANQVMAGKSTTVDGGRGWVFYLGVTGIPSFSSTPTGVVATLVNRSPGVSNPFIAGQTGWMRVVFDVDNGASGSTTTFYTSTDGVTWTILGAPQVVAGVTTTFDNAAVPYTLGDYSGASGSSYLTGNIYSVEIRSGIGGANVVAADPSTWTVQGGTVTPVPGNAPVAGSSLALQLTQDATGSRTVTWPANVKWPGGTAPTLSTAGGAVDYLELDCIDGVNWLGRTVGLAYA